MGGVELGLWTGTYMSQDRAWPRWWGPKSNLLLTGEERAEQSRQQAEQACQRADQFAAKLRELGIDPDKM